jgi:hypothetical protein
MHSQDWYIGPLWSVDKAMKAPSASLPSSSVFEVVLPEFSHHQLGLFG